MVKKDAIYTKQCNQTFIYRSMINVIKHLYIDQWLM
jgi:hypothetical protein